MKVRFGLDSRSAPKLLENTKADTDTGKGCIVQ